MKVHGTPYITRKGTYIHCSKQIFLRRCLPYGIGHCDDGREVLFDRSYAPICQRYPGRPATMADPAERVHWKQEEWLYNDGAPEREKRCAGMAVLEQWGMTQPVLHAAEHLAERKR